MRAWLLASTCKDALIGRFINTEQIGEWPGGLAQITALAPDPDAPEIVMQVKHPIFGEIGIFDYEEVDLK